MPCQADRLVSYFSSTSRSRPLSLTSRAPAGPPSSSTGHHRSSPRRSSPAETHENGASDRHDDDEGNPSPRTLALRRHFAEQDDPGNEAGRRTLSFSSEEGVRAARASSGGAGAASAQTGRPNRAHLFLLVLPFLLAPDQADPSHTFSSTGRVPASAEQHQHAQLALRRRDAMIGDRGQPSSPASRSVYGDPRDLAFLPSRALEEEEEPLPHYEPRSRPATPTSPCPSYSSGVPPYSPGSVGYDDGRLRASSSPVSVRSSGARPSFGESTDSPRSRRDGSFTSSPSRAVCARPDVSLLLAGSSQHSLARVLVARRAASSPFVPLPRW